MDCEQVREALSASMEDGVATLPAEVRTHLDSCANCRQAQSDYEAMDAELAAFYSSGKPLLLVRPPRRQAASRGRWSFVAAVAAVFALLVTGSLYFSHLNRGTRPPDGVAKGDEGAEVFEATVARLIEREGWRAWIGAGAKLKKLDGRNLELASGAAFFAVVPGNGPFSVKAKEGTVLVLGTEFSVIETENGARVSVREGTVRIENNKGALKMTVGEAGRLPSAGAAPEALAGVSIEEETAWRPWEGLDAVERKRRMSWLETALSDEDYGRRLLAREVLRETGADGILSAESWVTATAQAPRLKLEALIFLRLAPVGDAAARAAVRIILESNKEQDSIREQAAMTLGKIGVADDLAALDALAKDPAIQQRNLSHSLSAAAAEIRDRTAKD